MKLAVLLSAVILLPGTTLTAAADSPRDFLQKALQGDNSEMMLGQIAERSGSSRMVREYGATLVRDHAKARAQVLAVGRHYGLRDDRQPAPEASQERQKLAGMRGDEFDREFARYMVHDHENDIADFRDEAGEHHGQVSRLAESQLPTLEKHLRLAQQINNSADLGRPGPSRRH